MPSGQVTIWPAGQDNIPSRDPQVASHEGLDSADVPLGHAATSLVGQLHVDCRLPHVCWVHVGVPGLVLPLGHVATCPAGQLKAPSCEPHVGVQLGVVIELFPLGHEHTWLALVAYAEFVAIRPPQFIGQVGCSVVDCGLVHEQV